MKDNWDKALVMVAALMLVLALFFIKQVKSESGECISKPLVYGIRSIDQPNNATTVCSCSIMKNDKLSKFILTSEGIKPDVVDSLTSNYSIDLDLISSALDYGRK